jgi:hypothetical protein
MSSLLASSRITPGDAARTRYSSTVETRLFKYVFPALVSLVGTAVLIAMWPDGAASDRESWMLRAGLIAGWLLLNWLLQLSASNIKTVERCGDHLRISGGFKTISVPFSEVAGVSQYIITRPQMLTIKFTRKTEFGRKVQFIPDGRYLFSRHPIALEIERLAALASVSPQAVPTLLSQQA